MNVIFRYTLLVSLTCWTSHSKAKAVDPPELDPHLKKSVSWRSPVLKKEIPLKIYFQGTPEELEQPDVIVYLKNKAWERVGQESDLSILTDYLARRFIVITLDYGNDPQASSPNFDEDLNAVFREVFGYQATSLLHDVNLKPKEYRCFFLPEGYRVATDLVYWDLSRHGAFGTLEYIMQAYNDDIVPKVPGLRRVSDPRDMVDRKGQPFDFTVKMDIVYPSQPKKRLPVIIHSETLSARNPNERPHNYSPHFAGFLTRGYVYAVMGHCFNPCVNHYFHFGKFTMDHWNGFACYTAAIRFLHAHAYQYSLNADRIGMIGYSKGEYAVTRLSDPNHAGGDEVSQFKGFPVGSPQPQPWPGFPSKIAAGMQGMGMGLFETEYITADYAPNILICGEHDREVITEQHPVFVKRLEEVDANHISLFMQGQGHELPYGHDERMGVDRYQLVHDFFDRYLKVDDKIPPAVLSISPYHQQEGVLPSSTISVHFAPVIDERTVLKEKGVKIIRLKDNKEINGKWRVSHGGTKFTFTPAAALEDNEGYRVHVTTSVSDRQGTRIAKEKSASFTVTGTSNQPAVNYNSVKIGDQVWMLENLNVERFRNGDPIPHAATDEQWVSAGKEGKPAWCYYENKEENGPRYGKLYNWYAATDERGIAPQGWRVPTDADWRHVTDFLGGEDAAGTKMKSISGWPGQDGNGTNESGFSGLPGGSRNLFGEFAYGEEAAYWWTSTSEDRELAWYRVIDRSPWYVYRTNYSKANGLSVRCVRE